VALLKNKKNIKINIYEKKKFILAALYLILSLLTITLKKQIIFE